MRDFRKLVRLVEVNAARVSDAAGCARYNVTFVNHERTKEACDDIERYAKPLLKDLKELLEVIEKEREWRKSLAEIDKETGVNKGYGYVEYQG